MYYIRALFAVVAGLINGALDLKGDYGIVGVALGVAIFAATYLLFRYGISGIYENVKDMSKYYKVAIFSYFILWFVTWVISINLLFPTLP